MATRSRASLLLNRTIGCRREEIAHRTTSQDSSRMTYEGLDELVAVDLPGGLRVEYGYGYDGMRLRSRDNRGGPPEYWFADNMRMIGDAFEQYVRVGDRTVAKINFTFNEDARNPSDTAPPPDAAPADVGGTASDPDGHRGKQRAARLAG